MASNTVTRFYEELKAAQLPAVTDELLAQHTTFHIGGAAAVLCRPQTVQELTRTLELAHSFGVRYYLLGNGSNTLFADGGFDGAVILTTGIKNKITFAKKNNEIFMTATAGTMLSTVCTAAQRQGCTGLEFAYGVPGTLGGAVYMNAGAYGGELKDVLADVSYLDENLTLQTSPAGELALGYRTSIFEKKPWCILEATLRLKRGDKEKIQAEMNRLMQCRRDKQPLDMPSAGSTFKRPAGAFAGGLIEQCGLRGFTVGGAQISTKHCGFVVNCGGASCADVVALTEQVKKIVKAQTGYTLEREIRIVE